MNVFMYMKVKIWMNEWMNKTNIDDRILIGMLCHLTSRYAIYWRLLPGCSWSERLCRVYESPMVLCGRNTLGMCRIPDGGYYRPVIALPAGIWVPIPIFRKRPQSTDRGRWQHKWRPASLCTCIRAWLIQVSGYVRVTRQHCHILSHCHCRARWGHGPRSSVNQRHAWSLCVLILEPYQYKCPSTSDLLGCRFQYSANSRVNRPRPVATQAAASLCYIRAWLIQVSGHVGLILQHNHRPRIWPLVDQRRNTGTVQAEKVWHTPKIHWVTYFC